MKNEFEELQQIYEGFRVVNGMNPPYNVEVKPVLGQQVPDDPGNLSNPYYALRGVKGGIGNLYNRNQIPNTTYPVGDEEHPNVKEKKINNKDVIDYIDKLMDEAVKQEMSFAIHQLGSLKKFVESL
tara:strand:- start:712 stop:1089 length:378 start_codon:yes stop_codon:yes gene_type:complete